jgi:hypothetical protein
MLASLHLASLRISWALAHNDASNLRVGASNPILPFFILDDMPPT